MQSIALCLALLAVVATALPFIESPRWWIRGFDFPKPQVFIFSLLALLLWLIFGNPFSWAYLVVSVLLIVATAYTAWLILPFTPFWRRHVAQVDESHTDCFSLIASNVQMENEDHDAVLRMVEERDPDILLLVETNARWVEALAPLRDRYPHVTAQPQDNYYGLMFLTRLEVESVDLRFIVKDDVPSIRAVLHSPGGTRFVFFGMHPEPPVVGKDSDKRDAELMLLAKEMMDDETPAIVTGDLNDVAWSHTTREFRRISGTLDPRIGRGLYASFHADYRFARWPLDHLFVSPDFELKTLELHGNIGSDHFPVCATLCLTGNGHRNNAEPDRDADLEAANRKIEQGTDGN